MVDTVVLAMFVDAGRPDLLQALAGGLVFLTPTVLDPAQLPPFAGPSLSEFGRGLYDAEQQLGDPLLARRAQRRTVFYGSAGMIWQPVALSVGEVRLARYLASPATRQAARVIDPTFRALRIDPGEAECAAVAINRGWRLWSDDQAIVTLVRTLYPSCVVERLCGLLVRGVSEGLIGCAAAAHLYNAVFKSELRLWSRLTLDCQDGNATCR
ncbi:MAG TPA: hypothetical protein VMM78_14535 [Thermomicrobiales bacterium]|nr:hypothetical protein [Thermomicrobiales bacterium]